MRLRDWVQAQRPETVSQVAQRVGIARVGLHRLMAGHVMPTTQTCRAIEKESGGAVTWRDMEEAHAEYRLVLKDFAS